MQEIDQKRIQFHIIIVNDCLLYSKYGVLFLEDKNNYYVILETLTSS